MKKVLHIVGVKSTKFVKPFAQLLARTGIVNQMFLPVGLEEQKIDFYKDVPNCEMGVEYPRTYNPIAIVKFLWQFFGVLKKYDVIIWHSLFFQRIIFVIAYLFHKDIVHKSAWLVWGGDLYTWRSGNWLYDYCYKGFIKELKAVIYYFPPDKDKVVDEFVYGGQFLEGHYTDEVDSLLMRLKNDSKSGSVVRILVNHSAAPENKHIDCLEVLKKFRDSNIEIYLPMSYGDKEHAQRVEQYAKDNFVLAKVIVIQDFMTKEEYYSFLAKMDVALFGATRQIGLGNINVLLTLGKTLYLNEDGVMYRYFKERGLSVFKISDIEHTDFGDLIKAVDSKTQQYALDTFSFDKFKERWGKHIEILTSDCK